MKPVKALSQAVIVLTCLLLLSGCSPKPSEIITVRLWDQNVAKAYDKSLSEFTKESGIQVEVKVIPWADYWSQLRVDISSNSVDDIFWVNAGNFEEYANRGLLRPINPSDFDFKNWDTAVINQYSSDGELWGVPQLSDPGIGLFYNLDLLNKYGVSVDQVKNLSWNPVAKTDSLRQVAQQLTRDSANRPASDKDFDSSRVKNFGFNAAFDLNAIVLNFLGSNGAQWQQGDRFVFDTSEGRQTLNYISNLINVYKISPPANDTNPPAGGDLSRDLFLQGKMALFESGAYNLANIQNGAKFQWGIASIPRGPNGAVSVTNGIVASGSAKSKYPAAQLKVLQWLGDKGAKFIGETGSALTAVKNARASFFSYWAQKNVDVSPMLEVLANGYVQAPRGAKYAEAEAAYLPIFNDFFMGKTDVMTAARNAQLAANKAMGK